MKINKASRSANSIPERNFVDMNLLREAAARNEHVALSYINYTETGRVMDMSVDGVLENVHPFSCVKVKSSKDTRMISFLSPTQAIARIVSLEDDRILYELSAVEEDSVRLYTELPSHDYRSRLMRSAFGSKITDSLRKDDS